MTDRTISRRTFLKAGCLTIAATGTTICGASLLIPIPDPQEIETPTFNYGDYNMKNKVLVAYASGLGSTMEVANQIGKTLGEAGVPADVKPIQPDLSIEGYQALVLGSAVRYGEWLPEALSFVQKHHLSLQKLPVAVFCLHISNQGNDQTSRQNRLAYLNEIRELLSPVDEAYFAGKFDRRGAALLLPGWLARLVPTLDFRKWDRIQTWAASLPARLSIQTSLHGPINPTGDDPVNEFGPEALTSNA